MFSEAIGHGTTLYKIVVEKSGVATVSHEQHGDPHSWGIPAGKLLDRQDVPAELRERINRRIESGREVLGVEGARCTS